MTIAQIYPLDEFKRISVRMSWESKHNFVTIDLSSEKCMGKYRMNFNMFFIPETSNVER